MNAHGSSKLSLARLGAVATALMWLAIPPPAAALQYQFDQSDGGKYIVVARGPIVAGDADRLRTFIIANATKGTLLGFGFDSPGGSVLEGEIVANIVRATGAVVLIPDNATCASACFLILAAARVKLAGTTALIGVHSVSEGSTATTTSMAMTTAMARDASAYGVPPSIIGRMVATEPGRVAWLTPAELTSMGVKMLDQQTTASVPSGPTYTAPAMPVTPTSPQTPIASAVPMSMAFFQGKADRKAWEDWITGLATDARAGADFWAAQRSLPRPASCQINPPNQDWASGCATAQQRLAPIDARRKREQDYRSGWNSM